MTVIVSAMPVDDARRLTERIRLTAHSARESIEKLHVLVAEAKEGNVHVSLGYDSWTAYLSEVLGSEPLRLARDQRQELVGYLAGEGMSTRAIAPIVGTSREQVRKDIRSTDTKLSVEPSDPFDGSDWIEPEDEDDEPIEAEIVDEPAPRITGLNGKSYARPEPKAEPSKPRRQALPDQARTAGWDLRKAVERLETIAADDRFDANRDTVAPHLRAHLSSAVEVCQMLLDRINN